MHPTELRIVCICSGGMDSTVLYYYFRHKGNQVFPVNFHYGSKHNDRERRAALGLIPNLHLINIDLSWLRSSLTQPTMDIPTGEYSTESVKQTVVPFRNGVMLAYAVAYADDIKARAVAFGAHSRDHAIYPDCRPDFVRAFNDAARVGTDSQVNVVAPFVHASKGHLVKLAVEMNILDLLYDTWSCYKGGEIHCGVCSTCEERKLAFASQQVEDKTEYEVP